MKKILFGTILLQTLVFNSLQAQKNTYTDQDSLQIAQFSKEIMEQQFAYNQLSNELIVRV